MLKNEENWRTNSGVRTKTSCIGATRYCLWFWHPSFWFWGMGECSADACP